jgi:hypothetical protein
MHYNRFKIGRESYSSFSLIMSPPAVIGRAFYLPIELYPQATLRFLARLASPTFYQQFSKVFCWAVFQASIF